MIITSYWMYAFDVFGLEQPELKEIPLRETARLRSLEIQERKEQKLLSKLRLDYWQRVTIPLTNLEMFLKELARANVYYSALNLVQKVLLSASKLLLIKVISHLI